MAVSDITGVTGTIYTGEDAAGNITAFNGTTFWNTFSQDSEFMDFLNSHPNNEMSFLHLYYWDSSPSGWALALYLDTTFYYKYLARSDQQDGYSLAQLGITANLTTGGDDTVLLTVIYGSPVKLYGSVNGRSKEIKKLYGSVNGVSKEITKLYGSVNGVSKLIYKK